MLGFIYKLASPKYFYQISSQLQPWIWVFFVVFFSYGIIGALYLAPADYQQGEVFRIIYIHVPSAVLSLAIYLFMSVSAVIALVWRIKMAEVLFLASAPIGTTFTFLALVTGSIWGKPTWGTWWLWDARLTSELILLFLYFGVLALQSAIVDQQKAVKACALLVLVGTVDLPIIHYSVYWWNTLHQKATILKLQQPSIALEMLWPLLAMLVAFSLFFVGVLLLRTRSELLDRETQTTWVKELLNVSV